MPVDTISIKVANPQQGWRSNIGDGSWDRIEHLAAIGDHGSPSLTIGVANVTLYHDVTTVGQTH